MNRIRKILKRDEGIAMVEFAILLPVLLTFFYGCIEITRYVLISQKVEKLAFTVADVASQNKTLTQADLTALMSAANDIMRPYTMGSNGVILLSSLYRADGAQTATVNWTRSGGGTLVTQSRFGVQGAVPTMPAPFTFDNKENVIAAEVFFRFAPLITDQFFGTRTVYRAAFYRPRLGDLVTPPS